MSTHLLNTSRDGDSTTSLGSLFQCLIALSRKKFFPDTKPKPPLVQLDAISSCPVTCYLTKETDIHLTTEYDRTLKLGYGFSCLDAFLNVVVFTGHCKLFLCDLRGRRMGSGLFSEE